MIGAERERNDHRTAGEALVGLVDDLLDVSRITRGKVELRRAHVDLADLVAKAIEMASPADRGTAAHPRRAVPRGVGAVRRSARLAQVFGNLLNNAAKYTDPAGHHSRVCRARECEAVVRVIDTGRGIAPEMLPHVFDLFAQERQDSHRAQGGPGIGPGDRPQPGRGARWLRRCDERGKGRRLHVHRSAARVERNGGDRHDRSHGTFLRCTAGGPCAGGG